MLSSLNYILRILWAEHRGLFLWAAAFFTIEKSIAFVAPYIFGRIVGVVDDGQFVWADLQLWVWLLLATLPVQQFFDSYAIRLDIQLNARLVENLFNRAYRKLLLADAVLHENESAGKYLNKIRTSIDKIWQGVDQALYQFLPALVVVVGMWGILAYYAWQGGVLFGLSFLVLFGITLVVARFLTRIFSQSIEAEGRIGGYFVESLSFVRTVRYFAREHEFLERGRNMFHQFVTIWDVPLNKLTALMFAKSMVVSLQKIAVLGVALYLLSIQAIGMGEMVFILILLPYFSSSLHQLARMVDKLAEFEAAVKRYREVMERVDTVVDRSNPRPIDRDTVRGELHFDDVTFGYTGTNSEQFQNFSLTVQPGMVTALVGQSGSGKSSLVKLLYRLYDVQGGAVRLDGVDIREYAQIEYRSLLAIVPQDVELLNASLRENLCLGHNYTDEQIWQALDMAVLRDMVEVLPNGLATEVGERGVKLSGGEKQRLGIARALIRKPKILVLDEATSSLDTVSERMVKQAISNLEHLGLTMVVIAHRLSTIQDANRIVVLAHGQVVQDGTHDTLIAVPGVYRDLQGVEVM